MFGEEGCHDIVIYVLLKLVFANKLRMDDGGPEVGGAVFRIALVGVQKHIYRCISVAMNKQLQLVVVN